MSNFDDRYGGVALKRFLSKTLPLKLSILQKYCALPNETYHMSQSSLVSVIVGEVIGLWDCSVVPHKNYTACSYLAKQVVSG